MTADEGTSMTALSAEDDTALPPETLPSGTLLTQEAVEVEDDNKQKSELPAGTAVQVAKEVS
jgi:hypothetical protein